MSSTGSGTLKRNARNASISPPPMKRRQQSTTTQKAVANFFTPTSEKKTEPENVTWHTINDSLLVGRYQSIARSSDTPPVPRKIAAFDFDSTLIKSVSGNRFAKNAYDWKWWDDSVPSRLRELHQDGYLVAVLSNQGGINLKPTSKPTKSDTKRLADFKTKARDVLTQLDLPGISIYAACEKDQYRKPRVGMWTELLQNYGLEQTENAMDLSNSIFVGDAGGRLGGTGGAPKDFACSDRDLAHNVGVSFKTPEEFFLGAEERPFSRSFDPTLYLQPGPGTPKTAPSVYAKKNDIEIVLFCGSPGAGKSTFYWNYLKPLGYERINQDILKTRDKCLKVASGFIDKQVSVAVDNTNADPETRAHWTSLAKKTNTPIRCVLFTASPELAEHNNVVRVLGGGVEMNPEDREMLPKVAFLSFAKRYKEPRLNEGFQDITKVDFKFEGSEEDKSIWARFWV